MTPPSSSSQVQVEQLLARVRGRLRLRQLVGESLGWLAATVGGALLLLLVAGTWPVSGWGPVGICAATAVVLTFIALPLRALSRWRSDDAVARHVDRQAGLGDLALSAVELGRMLPSLGEAPVVSPSLVRALRQDVAARLARLDPRRVVPLTPLRRPALVALAAVAALGLIAATARPRLAAGWRAFTQRVVSVQGASDVAASLEPIIGDLEIELTYPAYTRTPTRTLSGASGEVQAPRGTVVTLRARALVPVSTAELAIEAEEKGRTAGHSEPVTVEGNRLTTRFTITGPGGYRFVFHPPRGAAVREAEPHRVEVEADRAPRVELKAKADELEVQSARSKVELQFSVDDDYGVGDVELVWRPDKGKNEKDRRVMVKRGPKKGEETSRTAQGFWIWDLADVDLQPGVRIAYHLEAKDNDDVAGPNVGSSRTLYLRVYSASEKHDEALTALQALLDHAVTLLADRVEADLRKGKEPPEPPAELEARANVHHKTESFLAEVLRVANGLDKDKMSPKDVRPALIEIHERLGRLERAEEELVRALRTHGGGLEGAALKPLRDGNQRHVVEMERDVILLDDLLGRQRLEQLLSVTDEMTRARDRLEKLLGDYKKSHSDAVKKEIEREIRELERRMAELAAKAAKLAGEVPDEFLNKEAMGDNDMNKRLDAIREMLAKGDVDGAMAELKRLSQSLDKMVSSLESNLKGYRNERFSPEERALADLENKLADLEHDERTLAKETDEIKARYQQERERMLKEKIEPLLKQAKQRVAEIKRRVSSVDPKTVDPMDHDSLDRTQKRIDELQRAIDRGDLGQAREMAQKVGNELNGLNYALVDEEQRQWTGTRQAVRKARGEITEAHQQARKLIEELDQALPKPEEMMGPGDRGKMAEQGARQEALRQRVEELRRELEKRASGQRAPGMMQQAGEGLREASDHMERASDKLARGEPRDAVSEEGQAADRLGQLRQQVEQQRRPREESGNNGSRKDEVVKIPGADEYRAPREFRQDLLDAMRRAAPNQYKEQVKRYYEELAR